MHKRIIGVVCLVIFASRIDAQLNSPEEFLGYKIGMRYTPRWKIVNYFGHVAANALAMIRLESYGETYEGRPLLQAFISSSEDISNLETISENNLRLATPGSIWKADMDNTNPLAFGYPDYYYTLKQDDAIYEFMKEGGWNVGVIKKENQVAGFVGARLQPELKDGLLVGVQNMDEGVISFLADDVLFRSFWENGKLMFCNVVFLAGK